MISLDSILRRKGGSESKRFQSLRLKDVMTSSPVTVKAKYHLSTIERLMSEHNIRHLPILDEKGVVGVLSDSDLNFIRSIYKERSLDTIRIDELVLPKPYIEDEGCLLKDALMQMVENKYGSVLIGSTEKITGIFTTIDVCRIVLDET